VIGDGDAMGVSAEITQGMFGSSERRFAIDHPVMAEQLAKPGGEDSGLSKPLQIAIEAKLPTWQARFKAATNLPRKTRLSTLTGRKKE
jgi:hypothetical protein